MNWLKRLLGDRREQTNDDELKSRAYLAYSVWGPEAVKHRDTQLADVFPDLPVETRRAWIAEFKQVDREISNVVGKFGEHDYKEFDAHLRAKFPFLNHQAIHRAWSLFTYYSIHG
ncbi:hypothetical protein ANRL3_02280 [Anaerolineae bacterium]|nr:hypothetical protein ANRL3_02280 [Anaerolineae bacterium]